MPEVDAVVVGAGQSGLAASWHLGRLGVEHVVLDAGRVGESWRSQRWDSFRLNSPTWSNRLPGDTAADDAGPEHEFVSGTTWAASLARYAERHRLPIQAGVRVTALAAPDPQAPHARFRLTLDDGDRPELCAGAVIVASGMQRVPRVPAVAADAPRGILALHSAAYRSPEALPPGGVLVVACAQTGGQIAEELLAAGRRVVVATSTVPRVPRRYRGRDIFARLGDTGWWEQVASDLPDPRATGRAQPIISGVGPLGHTLSLQGLARQGAQLAGRLTGFDGHRAHFAGDLPDSIRFGDRASAAAKARIDAWIATHEPDAPPAGDDPDPDDAPVADPDAHAGPTSLDLAWEGITTIIWSTGFGPDLAWGGPLLAGEDGLPSQSGGRGTTPGTWFLGGHWMRSRGSSLVVGAGRDAAFVAEEVAAFLGR